MRIGLDIDNVIADFDNKLLEEMLIHDKSLRNSGIINYDAKWVRFMFDWSNEEYASFMELNMERIASELVLLPYVRESIDEIKDLGHYLALISNRVKPHYANGYETTKKWLDKNELLYDKLVISKTNDKTDECRLENLDAYYDDSPINCKFLNRSNVYNKMVVTDFNLRKDSGLMTVDNLRDVLEELRTMGKKKVILDTDMANEVDDRFALAYLMKSINQFDLEAITIAPFSNSGYQKRVSVNDSIDMSYDMTLSILDMLNKPQYKNIVYKGDRSYLSDNPTISDGVNKIVELARANDKITIMAIGAITNVAHAILVAPDIIPKIKVVWLGGNSFLSKDNSEFNFRQDIKGVRTVFESGCELVVIPCKNVSSSLTTTIYELEHYLSEDNDINKYLLEEFRNVKKRFKRSESSNIGNSKTLWDLSVIAYELNANWFESEVISCPKVLKDGNYELTNDMHKVIFVNNVSRNNVYRDFFLKMGKGMTKDDALKILNDARKVAKYPSFIDHSLCVGDTAGMIADAIGLDGEKARIMGYIHDIGKRANTIDHHEFDGYNYLTNLGFSYDIASICVIHSYLNNDYLCKAGGVPSDIPHRTEFIKNHKYSIYDKIINLCDLMCTTEYIGLENRLEEIISRKGYFPNTDYHMNEAFKLRNEIESLLGCSIDSLMTDSNELNRVLDK